MFENLVPDQYFKSIFEINFKQLHDNKFKGIICDIDNTIVPYKNKIITDDIVELFENINNMFKICLVSNGMDSRVDFISKKLNIPAIGQAVKPGKKAYKHAIDILKLDKKEIVVIGDQIFTDVLGGNRMGLETILVNPMDDNEFIITRLVRKLESLVFTRK